MKTWKHLIALFLAIFAVAITGCQPDKPAGEFHGLDVQVKRSEWGPANNGGVLLATKNYDIHTTIQRRKLLRQLPGYMEAANKNYTKLTGLSELSGREPRTMYIMASRDQWAALTRDKMGRQADLFMNIGAGGYCYEGVCVLWDIGMTPTLSVASHEGLHQFFAHRLRGRLPLWLEEGMCVLAEGHRVEDNAVAFTPRYNPARHSNLRTAIINGHWVPIWKLLPMDGGDAVKGTQDQAVGYYGQVWALAMFLQSREDYRQGVHRLTADAETGRLHIAAGLSKAQMNVMERRGRLYNRRMSRPFFEYYITKDIKTFEREYREFARELADLK